jgi:tetratricopeptide (TPR) repeat protein
MKNMTWFVVLLLLGCSKTAIDRDPSSTGSALSEAPSERVTSLAPGAPTVPAEATAFQKSYDDEAQGKVELALADLEGIHPSGNAAYVLELRRGWLLYQLAKHADAVAAYAKAGALIPAAIEPKLGALAPLAALRRWNDVVATASEVLAKDAGNYAARLRLAFAQYSQTKYADAEASYRSLAGQYPSDVEVRAGLGWSLVKLGRLADASTVFGEILAVAPKNALALEGIATLKR